LEQNSPHSCGGGIVLDGKRFLESEVTSIGADAMLGLKNYHLLQCAAAVPLLGRIFG